MKEAYYFSHDYNSRNDQKILLLRSKYQAEGYGVFWMLIEIMAESTLPHINQNMIPAIAVSLNMDATRLNEIVEFCITECGLFVSDGISFTSMRLIRHRQIREEFREAGYRGALKRWNSPPISPPISGGNAKERKGKEIKDNGFSEAFESLWNQYPRREGKKQSLKHFKTSVKTKEDLTSIQTALVNYIRDIEGRQTDPKYIKMGSTWFNNWRDWVVPPSDLKKKAPEWKALSA